MLHSCCLPTPAVLKARFRYEIARELPWEPSLISLLQISCFGALSIVLSLSKNRPVYFSKHNVSKAGFWHRCPEIGTSSIDWAQLCRFYLKTETESSLRNAVLWKINRTVFFIKTRRWIMSRNVIFVLMYHRHKLLHLSSFITFTHLKFR
jgi:hypothetical protein